MKLRKGDHVRVIAGKDIGKEGEVARVITKTNRVIVDGINIAKKHQRQIRRTMQAGIIDKDMPIDASNVMIICGTCGPTRIGYRFDDEGRKHRVCRRCEGEL
jgi:large subunit ribosomal protein L24